jgi:two-component system, NtrC family, sensor kinase
LRGAGGGGSIATPPIPIERSPGLPKPKHRERAERLSFLLQIVRDLERFAADEEPDRFLRHVHRGLGAALGADLGFVWRFGRGLEVEASYHMTWTPRGEKLLPRTKAADLRDQAVRFARDRKSPNDPQLLMAVVEVLGRAVGVFAFIRPTRTFGRADARLGIEAAEILGRHLGHRERERTFELREKIVRKVLLQLRPADILYQVLHGLKRLLRYDHSASVLTLDREGRQLVVRAEIIAWTKGKSARIGSTISLNQEEVEFISSLAEATVIDPNSPGNPAPRSLCERLHAVAPDAPPTRSVIHAALRQKDETVGLLLIRALAPDAFVEADKQTIDSFLHIVSATALHSEFFRQQQDRLLDAERRTALGDLARAISHDLSNSFGVIQPLLETLRRDVDAGELNPPRIKADLEMLTQYVSTSLRIFQGLLSFARSSIEEEAPIRVGDSLEAVLTLLDRSLRTQRIDVVKELSHDLPRIQARRQDLEQVFLNLLNNAKDSMPGGGRLTVRSWLEKDGDMESLRLSIADTGCGIPAAILPRVFEPFFTTKKGGTGLGLDICRSIVWEYDGALWLESKEGAGTTAQIRLPVRRGQGLGNGIS